MSPPDTPTPEPTTRPSPHPGEGAGAGRLRRLVGLLLIVIPLALSALWAVVGPAPEHDDSAARSGGPVQSALSEAAANSSFTVAGADQLRDGSAEI